jgi:aminopeptidase N
MSSYLVAFIVSNFKTIQKISSKNVLVEVAAKPEPINNGDGEFSLNEASEIIDYFSDYFDVPYPLEKSSITLILNSRKQFLLSFLIAQTGVPDFNAGGKVSHVFILLKKLLRN